MVHCVNRKKKSLPQLGCDSEILTATHQCIGFATFRGGGQAAGIKVILLSTSGTHEAASADEGVFSGYRLRRYRVFRSGSKTPPYNKSKRTRDIVRYNRGIVRYHLSASARPTTRTKCPVQNAAVLDLGQIQQTI